MSEVVAFFQNLFDAEALIVMLQHWGWLAYIVLFAIIFAETGLLIGFCLPGDSLLFVAGFACSPAMENALSIWILLPALIVAATVGDTVGYWLGHSTGPRIFCREDSLFFHRKHLNQAAAFYDKFGGRSIVLARFVPIVRTFVPFVAGVGQMNYSRFLQFNIWGGLGWISSMMSLGYFLGETDWVRKNLETAILGVVFLSLTPVAFELLRGWMQARREKAAAADLAAVDVPGAAE